MQTITIQGRTGLSKILIGERLGRLETYLPPTRTVVITDTHVRCYYEKDFPACPLIEIGTGESVKTIDTVRSIYEQLVAIEADRSVFIVGIGGGIVCDIAGFVASTYLRGVRFAFVSTTLLSQVDASVGGKNGVNFGGYKNMVGSFNQPEFVICDPSLLTTLPEEEILSGMGEIVKHAVLGDADLFAYLETHHRRALALEDKVIERLVYDSVRLKASIVHRDELETGERRKLNLGHTFGHAVEAGCRLPHGQAVAVGTAVAAEISVSRGLLPASSAARIESLLKKLHLPTRLAADKARLIDALRKDKKRSGEDILFVLPDAIGSVQIQAVTIPELEKIVYGRF